MRISNEWKDYECLDAGNGEKLERWGNIAWKKVDGVYYRFVDGGGHWEFNKKLPDFWTVNYKDLKFKVSPTNFKHTGIFPEQAANWDFIQAKVKEYKENHNENYHTECADSS